MISRIRRLVIKSDIDIHPCFIFDAINPVKKEAIYNGSANIRNCASSKVLLQATG